MGSLRYILLTAAASLAVAALIAIMNNGSLYPLMFMPVLMAAYFGGGRLGVLSMVCVIAGADLIARVLGRPPPATPATWLFQWLPFVTIAMLGCVLSDALHRARRRAELLELSRTATLANIADAVVVTDMEGRVVYMNPAAERLCSVTSRKHALGRPLERVVPLVTETESTQSSIPPPTQHWADRVRAAPSTLRLTERCAIVRPDGGHTPVFITAAPMRPADAQSSVTHGMVLTLRDATGERREEEAIRARLALQDQLQHMAAVSPGALHVFHLSTEGRLELRYASASYRRLLALTDLDPEHFFESICRRMGEHDRMRVKDILRDSAAALQPVHTELRIATSKHTEVWCELKATPERTADGGTLWYATLMDISTRKAEEQALRESEARLGSIIASSMDAIVTLDERLGIVLFNPAAELMFLKPAATMYGKDLATLFSECFSDSDRLLELLRHPGSTQLPRRNEVLGRRGGAVFPIEWSMSRAQVNEHALLTLSLRDISERREAERQLRASQADLRAALEAGSLGVLQVMANSGAVQLDVVATQQFGLGAGLVSTRRLLRVILAEDRQQVIQAWRHAMSRHQPLNIEVRVRHADGEMRWLACRGRIDSELTPQADREPRLRLTCIITDVSFRRQLEEQRLRSQKLEALGVLAGGIAHDFNNLLLAISGNVRLASGELPPTHPVQSSLQETIKATTRATALVRRILAFSRPQDHEFRVMELSPVISEVMQLARAALPASLRLDFTLPADAPVVYADADQIHQAVLNLLTNAADAVDPFKGVIRVCVDRINVSSYQAMSTPGLHAGAYARVTVSDNGPGITPSVMQRIFDPFYSTKPRGQGTGLGLAIVHGIMSGHSGAVTAKSEPGRGASLALYFPLQHAAVPVAPTVVSPPTARATARILYVDDEEALVYLMTRTLERQGHRVRGFNSPEDALQVFAEDPDAFDIVVSDLSMPGMSGIEMAERMMAMRLNLPVIITTGYVKPEDQERARAVGVRQIILKPNTVEELGTVIQQVLSEPALRSVAVKQGT